MLRFHIDITKDIKGRIYGFEWSCYSMNNTLLFTCVKTTTQFRNCVNHIKTITNHMKDGSYTFVVTKKADEFRKSLGEKRYGT